MTGHLSLLPPSTYREVPADLTNNFTVLPPRAELIRNTLVISEVAVEQDLSYTDCVTPNTPLRFISVLQQYLATFLEPRLSRSFTGMDNDDPLSFELPNLDHLDLVELSYDSSSSMSSDCSPLNSPVMSPAYSPAPSTSSSLSTSPLPPAASPDLPSLTQKSRKHRSRCRTPHCTKKEHASVLRRNERERNRVKLVSDGFTNLRKHVPTNPSNKKLSKVETLRTAIEYIKHLQRILNESKRLERQKRLVRQVGWLQEAYNLQSLAGNTLATRNAMNSILMELPDIAPYPSQGNGSYGFPMSELNLTSFYSPVS